MSSYRNRNYNRRDYVPKWKQEEDAKKAEEDAKVKSLKNTEDNFPSLGGNMVAPKQSWSTGTASFKDLASEWRQKDEMEKVTAELAKNETVLFPEVVLPKFNNVHRYTDDTVLDNVEDTDMEKVNEDVEKKFEQSEDEKKFDQDEKKFDQDEKKFDQDEKKFDQDEKKFEQSEDDGWVTVQHKKTRKDKGTKKSEEIQKLTEEDFETSSQGSDTVWNAHLAGGPRGKNTFG
jgi:hypothetical protein